MVRGKGNPNGSALPFLAVYGKAVRSAVSEKSLMHIARPTPGRPYLEVAPDPARGATCQVLLPTCLTRHPLP